MPGHLSESCQAVNALVVGSKLKSFAKGIVTLRVPALAEIRSAELLISAHLHGIERDCDPAQLHHRVEKRLFSSETFLLEIGASQTSIGQREIRIPLDRALENFDRLLIGVAIKKFDEGHSSLVKLVEREMSGSTCAYLSGGGLLSSGRFRRASGAQGSYDRRNCLCQFVRGLKPEAWIFLQKLCEQLDHRSRHRAKALSGQRRILVFMHHLGRRSSKGWRAGKHNPKRHPERIQIGSDVHSHARKLFGAGKRRGSRKGAGHGNRRSGVWLVYGLCEAEIDNLRKS